MWENTERLFIYRPGGLINVCLMYVCLYFVTEYTFRQMQKAGSEMPMEKHVSSVKWQI